MSVGPPEAFDACYFIEALGANRLLSTIAGGTALGVSGVEDYFVHCALAHLQNSTSLECDLNPSLGRIALRVDTIFRLFGDEDDRHLNDTAT